MDINPLAINKIKPFLKWAGGKTQLLGEIAKRIPFNKKQEFTYIEPFVGSGAVFFWIVNQFPNIKKVIINDVNTDLISLYQCVAKDTPAIIKLLRNWEREYHMLEGNGEKKSLYYYSKRALYNQKTMDPIIQSALFIFLNRTCYNGLYRVNKKNLFNVPIGSYKKPMICDEINLYKTSQLLKHVEIISIDFEDTLELATENSFFYMDPPYKPLNKTSNFNSYSRMVFGDDEQIRLKEFCDKLNLQGHKWLLSNSDPNQGDQNIDFFDNLYSNYKIERILAKRSINSKAKNRGLLNELLISNY